MNRLFESLNFSRWTLQRKLNFLILVSAVIEVISVALSVVLFQQNTSLGQPLTTLQFSRFVSTLLIGLSIALLFNVALWLLVRTYIVRPFLQIGANLQMLNPELSIGEDKQDELTQLDRALTALASDAQQMTHQIEEQVIDRTRQLTHLLDIITALSGLSSDGAVREVEVLADQAVKLILERFYYVTHAQIFIADSESGVLALRASAGDFGNALMKHGYQLAVGSSDTVSRVFAERTLNLSRNLTLTALAETVRPGTHVQCLLPMRVGGQPMGVLDLQSSDPNALGSAELEILQATADHVGAILQNSLEFQESRAQQREFEAMSRLLVVDTWRDYVQTRRFKPVIATTGNEELSALQTQAVQTGSLAEYSEGDKVTFAMPILLRGQAVGAVEWEVLRSAYTENTRLLATELVARLALAADNARLLEQSQRLVVRERWINDISNKLTQQTDVTQILQTAVRELGQALQVAQTSIRLSVDD